MPARCPASISNRLSPTIAVDDTSLSKIFIAFKIPSGCGLAFDTSDNVTIRSGVKCSIKFVCSIPNNAKLVHQAFSSVPYNLYELEMFHTDRGKEFDNSLIDQALETFGIERSLSEKGSPYDNAVAEATFKSIKTEFVYGRVFSSQQELDLELFDYVNWFNNIRIHGSLNYQSPVEYKRTNL